MALQVIYVTPQWWPQQWDERSQDHRREQPYGQMAAVARVIMQQSPAWRRLSLTNEVVVLTVDTNESTEWIRTTLLSLLEPTRLGPVSRGNAPRFHFTLKIERDFVRFKLMSGIRTTSITVPFVDHDAATGALHEGSELARVLRDFSSERHEE